MLEIQQQPESQAGMAEVAGHLSDVRLIEGRGHLRVDDHEFIDEPRVSSDGGVLLLREVDRQLGLMDRLAEVITDNRRASHVAHQIAELMRQRAYQISCGYEDADDCDHMRADPALKTAVGRDPTDDPDLGSQPTMTRLENAVTARDLLRLGYAFIDQFIASYDAPPEVIVLDMDPTADHAHGHQQLAFFNAYEDEYCFMPFHVYEGLSGRYITSVLRAGKTFIRFHFPASYPMQPILARSSAMLAALNTS